MPDPTIAVAVSDLMLQSRVREGAQALGYDTIIADSDESLAAALDGAATVILDLQSPAIDWRSAIEAARSRRVPVLAFGQHTKPDVLRQARDAGAARAVPRSTLVEELEALLTSLAAP